MNFDLPDVTLHIDVEGEDYPLNLRHFQRELKIDPNNLDDELARQAGMYAWAGVLAANAETAAKLIEHDFDVWYAEQCSEVRAGYAKTNPKIAAAAVEAEVMSEEDYSGKKAEVLEAKNAAAMAAVAREAARMRQYMLTAIAKSRSQEDEVGV